MLPIRDATARERTRPLVRSGSEPGGRGGLCPDRWVERLFAAAAAATDSAWLLRLAAEPGAFLTNALILVAAVLDASIVFLQLRLWTRAMRSA